MKYLDESLAFVRARDAGHAQRKLLLVLGSGWGDMMGELLQVQGRCSYRDIPGFPVSTVAGHAGELIWGSLAGVPVYCMMGRFHYYEGYSMAEITFPMRVFARLGVAAVLLTNAAGGLREDLVPGTLMAISDHLNLMGDHPLRGTNDESFGPRFPDMTSAWDRNLRRCLVESAAALQMRMPEGVYAAVSGPSFETPAEIRAFARLGADAVGMSTVPECLVARHSGMRVAGISCITNLAAGLGHESLSHEDVSATAKAAGDAVRELLAEAIPAIQSVI